MINVATLASWVNIIAYAFIVMAFWNFIDALFGGGLGDLAGRIPGLGGKDRDERKPSKDEEDGKSKKQKEPQGEIDPTRNSAVGFKVVDLEGFPLQNAHVELTGKLYGKNQTYQFESGSDGVTNQQSVPSGPFVLKVKHKSMDFLDCLLFWGQYRQDPNARTRIIPLLTRGKTRQGSDFFIDPQTDNHQILLIVKSRRNWRPHIISVQDRPDDRGIPRKYAVGEITYHER